MTSSGMLGIMLLFLHAVLRLGLKGPVRIPRRIPVRIRSVLGFRGLGLLQRLQGFKFLGLRVQGLGAAPHLPLRRFDVCVYITYTYMYVCMYIYIYVFTYVHLNVNIYIDRERER